MENKITNEYGETWTEISNGDIVTSPVLGADADGLYLRGFRIKTNALRVTVLTVNIPSFI